MTASTPNTEDLICRIQLAQEGRWVSVSLSLSTIDATRRFFVLPEDISCDLAGLDELSRGYTIHNWKGGVISGAAYAFRVLQTPLQQVRLHELHGQLGSEDVEIISFAAALAVARLVDRPDPPVNLDGWKVEAKIRHRRPSEDGHSDAVAAVSAPSAEVPVTD